MNPWFYRMHHFMDSGADPGFFKGSDFCKGGEGVIIHKYCTSTSAPLLGNLVQLVTVRQFY